MFTLETAERKFHEEFLSIQVPELARKLKADKIPLWGKMTPQHMVEHMQVGMVSSSIIHQKEAAVPNKMQQDARNNLIYSNNDFPRNLQNPMFRFGLPAYTNPTLEEAIEKMNKSLEMFFKSFAAKPGGFAFIPFFGDLNYEELLIFHAKHFKHHFTQFELIK